MPRGLDAGYTSEVDTVDAVAWHQALREFTDANIYQTWPYAEVMSGRYNMSHVILRKNGTVAAVAQARIARIPVLNAGIAYVLWGPLWQRRGAAEDVAVFRQMVRAMRAEYVRKRGLNLRLFPVLFDRQASLFLPLLEEEGFLIEQSRSRSRTILMDVTPSMEELREGMKAHWKRELKVAEKGRLEILEGSGEAQLTDFIEIYREMVARKHFVEPNDINKFRLIQARLPEDMKMKVLLCRSDEGICAGIITSAIGKMAVYLFGATSNAGMKSRGSYLLQWKSLAKFKQGGVTVYDLNGINPENNPGSYKFKSDLAGKYGTDAFFLGRFDAPGSLLSRVCIQGGDMVRAKIRQAREFARISLAGKIRPSLAR